MGTNYYATPPPCPNPCAHCGAEDEVHIGKSLTMFEAHETSPWGPISSWQDWKRIIAEHAPEIRSEYGTVLDPAQFIADVEATKRDDRRRQYNWCARNLSDLSRDYLDPDGFSWHRGEFS